MNKEKQGLKGNVMPDWLVCLAQKHTKKLLSEIYEVEAADIYQAASKLEEYLGRKIDGTSEYADCCCVTQCDTIAWYLQYSC